MTAHTTPSLTDETMSAEQVLLDAIKSYCASFDPPRSPDVHMAGLLHLLMLVNPDTNAARDQLRAVTRHLEELLSNARPSA
jgi:hypothetical protein